MQKNTEFKVLRKFASRPELMLHDRIFPTPEAKFAMMCIERWAIVAGIPDGEDTVGRQKLRRMTPAEIVTEACAVSEQAFSRFRELGWLVDTPSVDDIEAESRRLDEEDLEKANMKRGK